MDRKQIEKEIELQFKKMKDFTDLTKLYPLTKKQEEAYINACLDRINELKEELKKLKD